MPVAGGETPQRNGNLPHCAAPMRPSSAPAIRRRAGGIARKTAVAQRPRPARARNALRPRRQEPGPPPSCVTDGVGGDVTSSRAAKGEGAAAQIVREAARGTAPVSPQAPRGARRAPLGVRMLALGTMPNLCRPFTPAAGKTWHAPRRTVSRPRRIDATARTAPSRRAKPRTNVRRARIFYNKPHSGCTGARAPGRDRRGAAGR